MLLTSSATAQNFTAIPDIPRELLNPLRRVEGEKIRFCYYPNSVTAELDVAIAQAVGEVLLLDTVLVKAEGPISLLGIDFIPLSEDDLFLFLSNDCDAFLGFTLAIGAYSDWMTFTRSYVKTDFVIVARDDSVTELDQLSQDGIIGSVMMSEVDIYFSSILRVQTGDRHWRRFPYPDTRLLLQRLLDGTVDVAAGWKPTIMQMQALLGAELVNVEAGSFKLPTRETGMVLLGNQAYLRSAIDHAIEALIAQGDLPAIYESVGFPGRVP